MAEAEITMRLAQRADAAALLAFLQRVDRKATQFYCPAWTTSRSLKKRCG